MAKKKNKKESSDGIASLASEVLRNPNSGKKAKKLAGSVLSQSNSAKQPKKKPKKKD